MLNLKMYKYKILIFFSVLLSEWYSILTRVKNSQEFELKQMHDEEANPKNAIGSLDVAIIDSVVPVNIASK